MTPIELAPRHKYGFSLANPVILGAGTVGYGEALPPGLDLGHCGAAVVGPFLRHSRAGREPPRAAETNGGIVLDTGVQSRGVNAAIRRYARLWPEFGCPVIVQIADTQPRLAAAVAQRLCDQPGVLGVELLLPRHLTSQEALEITRRVQRACALPLMAKLPLESASHLAAPVLDGGASALVIGTPSLGCVIHARLGAYVIGNVYGPLTFAATLLTLRQLIGMDLGCPLVAAGGIHTLEQARQVLASGANALQVDSVVWVEPGIPALLAGQL